MNNRHKTEASTNSPNKNGRFSEPSLLARLRNLILTGEYQPDERLIEEQIAERLGVSRTPVRQALVKLEAEGLVEIPPNRGAVVCSFSIEDVWDIYDLRAELEGYGARRAAFRIDKEGLEKLRRLTGEMEELLDQRSREREEEIRLLVSLNGEFHDTIAEASENRRLQRLIQRTVEVPLVFKSFLWYTPEERRISNHYHRKILGALQAGDGSRSEIVMRGHIYEGRDCVIKALEENLKKENP